MATRIQEGVRLMYREFLILLVVAWTLFALLASIWMTARVFIRKTRERKFRKQFIESAKNYHGLFEPFKEGMRLKMYREYH